MLRLVPECRTTGVAEAGAASAGAFPRGVRELEVVAVGERAVGPGQGRVALVAPPVVLGVLLRDDALDAVAHDLEPATLGLPLQAVELAQRRQLTVLGQADSGAQAGRRPTSWVFGKPAKSAYVRMRDGRRPDPAVGGIVQEVVDRRVLRAIAVDERIDVDDLVHPHPAREVGDASALGAVSGAQHHRRRQERAAAAEQALGLPEQDRSDERVLAVVGLAVGDRHSRNGDDERGEYGDKPDGALSHAMFLPYRYVVSYVVRGQRADYPLCERRNYVAASGREQLLPGAELHSRSALRLPCARARARRSRPTPDTSRPRSPRSASSVLDAHVRRRAGQEPRRGHPPADGRRSRSASFLFVPITPVGPRLIQPAT